MNEDQIKALNCKKHVKIYKLKQLGMANSAIAKALETNAGHVYNALKKYDLNPALKLAADSIIG